jgi:excisionase family DNA binding protein
MRCASQGRKENMNNTNSSSQEAPLKLANKRVYSVEEIAEILDVGMGAAYNLCKQNVFHWVRVGTNIRISKPSFDAWLGQQTN